MTPARPGRSAISRKLRALPPTKLVYIVYMNERVGGARVRSGNQEVNQVLSMGAEG